MGWINESDFVNARDNLLKDWNEHLDDNKGATVLGLFIIWTIEKLASIKVAADGLESDLDKARSRLDEEVKYLERSIKNNG